MRARKKWSSKGVRHWTSRSRCLWCCRNRKVISLGGSEVGNQVRGGCLGQQGRDRCVCASGVGPCNRGEMTSVDGRVYGRRKAIGDVELPGSESAPSQHFV